MPVVKTEKYTKERFRCETKEEVEIIEEAQKEYCQSHDNYEFVKEFFGIGSLRPGCYINSIKNGQATILIERWNKLKDYASRSCGK